MVVFVNTNSFGLFGCNKHLEEKFIPLKIQFNLRIDINNPQLI